MFERHPVVVVKNGAVLLQLGANLGAAPGDRVAITCRLASSGPGSHSIPQELNGGGAYRDRTDDPLLAKQVLSQLS